MQKFIESFWEPNRHLYYKYREAVFTKLNNDKLFEIEAGVEVLFAKQVKNRGCIDRYSYSFVESGVYGLNTSVIDAVSNELGL